MVGFLRHLARLVTVLIIGGFLGATLVRMAPGCGVDIDDLDIRLNGASHEALRAERACSGSLPAYYAGYWKQILHGDLGVSIALHEPIRTLLAERIPETARSIAVGLILAWSLGLGLALSVVSGARRWTGSGASFISSLLLCTPAALIGLFFVLAEAPPRFAVGLIVFPKIFQFARNLLTRCSAMPHVLAARARGIGNSRILLVHVLPVATPQLLALGGVSVCLALAAAIPVEAICDLPGIGQLAWKAALGRDLPLLVNLTMIVTLVTLVANSCADLLSRGPRLGRA